MANHLTDETSPYLLQHVDNPVDWYPWGAEAFEKARKEDKPIFLSVGYSSCYWCHVMEHESFEDESIAGFLNEHFISIKVDREERPDLDQIYMNAVQLMTGQGGKRLKTRTGEQVKLSELIDEAVERANATSYGLNASVWSGSGCRGREVAARLRAGTVNVNDLNAVIVNWGACL